MAHTINVLINPDGSDLRGGRALNLSAAMSSPTATPQTSTPDPGFDPVAFWYLAQTKIIALVAIFAVGLLGYVDPAVGWKNKTRTASEAAFKFVRSRRTILKKVIAEYGSRGAGANAQLRLAELQRKDGKFDESTATLKLLRSTVQHPLIAGALAGHATSQEAAARWTMR